jgi:DNA polymerase
VSAALRTVTIERSLASWRSAARSLLAQGVPPDAVVFHDDPGRSLLPGLMDVAQDVPAGAAATTEPPPSRVPAAFLQLAENVSCHRDPSRWGVLYRLLYRLARGERHLLEIASDDDVRRARDMEKAVRRDRHKMTAFVRFRVVADDDGEHYVAFHRPDHFVVPLVAEFFRDRFAAMRWSIFTPDESLSWDGHALRYGPGVERSPVEADDLETLWRTYYRSIFNPARIKLRAMRAELPQRHWRTLPETQILPDLLLEAPRRVEEMMQHSASARSARDYLPPVIELPQLREASKHCRGCDLYCNATQTVFGEGEPTAQAMFVGEQPGDQEDQSGRPFVGPAGQVLDEAMEAAGVDRKLVYVTNAVKHFKFTPRGSRRIHAKPTAREMAACRPWLEAELQVVKPVVLVCLGATAAQSLLGAGFRITQSRGQVFESPWCRWTLATWHPSAVLRTPDDRSREAMRQQLIDDLKLVAKHLVGG